MVRFLNRGVYERGRRLATDGGRGERDESPTPTWREKGKVERRSEW
jgi:hypothetical protein